MSKDGAHVLRDSGLIFVAAVLIACIVALLPNAQAYAAADALEAGSAELSAQSSRTYITLPESGASYNIGDTVQVNAYSGIYFFYRGLAVSNYITFKVTKGGKKVHYDYGWFNSVGTVVSTSFTPKEPGKYKIEIAGPSFSEASYDSFSATDSVTITVNKAASFKNVEPQVSSKRIKTTRVEISWAATGTGAKIYRATERNGKYKLIKTTKATSFTDKVNAKKDYFYKVRLYLKYGGKTYLSKFSGIESKFSTKPGKPTITKAVKVAKGVKIKWKQPMDCGHFTILRATKKNGKYEVVNYVSGDAKMAYTDKTVKAGKKYFYKVEADNYMDWSGDIKGTQSKPLGVKA